MLFIIYITEGANALTNGLPVKRPYAQRAHGANPKCVNHAGKRGRVARAPVGGPKLQHGTHRV